MKRKEIQVIYSVESRKDLGKLDLAISNRIVRKIDSYLEDPLREAKPLRGEYRGYHRYRIGEYRAIFEYDQEGKINILMILKIGHRRNVY